MSSLGPSGVVRYVVAPAGGDFSSIGQVLRAAPPGARIAIRPGVYRESLAIEQPVELVGEGEHSQIVIESHGAGCIRSRAARLYVQGVTLRARFTQVAENYALEIHGGQARIYGCVIDSTFMGMGIKSAEASVAFCDVHATHIGVYVTAGSRARIERSILAGASWAAVDVSEQSQVTVVSCDLKGNPGRGLSCTSARARIENSVVAGNGRAADARDVGLCEVVADQGGVVEIMASQINDCGTSGLMADNGGRIVVEDSEIANATAAFAVGQGKLEMRRCRIYNGKASGILLAYGGLAEVGECEITGNADMGVLLSENSAGNFRRCVITGNQKAGVGLVNNARAVIEGSDLRNNGAGAWSVSLEAWLAGSQNTELEPGTHRTYYLYGSKSGDRHDFKQFVTFMAPAFKPTAVLEVIARALRGHGSVQPQVLDRPDLPGGKYFTAGMKYEWPTGAGGEVAVTVVAYQPPDNRTGIVLAFQDARYPGWLVAQAESAVAGAVYATGMALLLAFPCPRVPAWRMQFGDWLQEQTVRMSDGTWIEVKRMR